MFKVGSSHTHGLDFKMKRKLSPAQSLFLDLTRGLSALAVLFGHALSTLNTRPALGSQYPIQSYGVVIFFIISGFLIGYNCYQRSDNYSFKDYMIDRFSRIYTVFIPAALFIMFVDYFITSKLIVIAADRLSFTTAVANLALYFQTPVNRIIPGFPVAPAWGTASQWWTVAVEWWLYVLFGIIFFLRGSSTGEKAVMAVLAIPAFLVVLLFTAHESLAIVWFIAAAAGVAFSSSHFKRSPGSAVALIGFLVCAYLFRLGYIAKADSVNFYDLPFMLLSTLLFFSILIPLYNHSLSDMTVKYIQPIAQWTANISYSLYLTHLTIIAIFAGAMNGLSYFGLIASCMTCIILAHIFYHFFDRRHKEVRDYLKIQLGHESSIATRFGLFQTKIATFGLIAIGVSAVSIIVAAHSVNDQARVEAEWRQNRFLSIRNIETANAAFFGTGEIFDPERGISLWQRSVSKGVVEAEYMLAIYAPDRLNSAEKREELLNSAAIAGFPDARLALLELSPENISSAKSTAELATIYAQATSMNMTPLQSQQERGARILLRMSELGNTDAMVMYGDAIRSGRMHQEQPISVAVQFWESASERGSALASYLLGETYFSGSGDVEPDKAKAEYFYRLAVQRAYPVAEARLQELGINP